MHRGDGLARRRRTRRWRPRAVVIADGGFPGDPELFRRHIGPSGRSACCSATPAPRSATASAWRQAAGAALTRLDRFYGHLMSRDAMENDGLWPYPQIDAVATAAIVVDRDGKRLLDEGLGGISITNDLARLDDPLCATVICDAAIWDTAGRAAQIPPNPQLVKPAAARCTEPTRSRTLAHFAGLDPATCCATRWRVQRRGARRQAAELSPPRSAKSGAPRPIEDAAVLTRSRSAPASRTRSAASPSTAMAGCAVPTAR